MQIVIHGINRKEKFSNKTGAKFESLGLKYRGKWYSGFGSKFTDSWDVGMTVDVDLWEEPGSDEKMYGKFVALIPNNPKNTQQKTTNINQETGAIDDLEDIPDDQDIAEIKANSEEKEKPVADDLPF